MYALLSHTGLAVMNDVEAVVVMFWLVGSATAALGGAGQTKVAMGKFPRFARRWNPGLFARRGGRVFATAGLNFGSGPRACVVKGHDVTLWR